MEVRNWSGVTQVDSLSGIRLPPMSLNEWATVPPEVGFRLWQVRKVEIRDAGDLTGHWWKEPDGTHIFWSSPFSLGDGYGTAACALVQALMDAGLKIHIAWTWFHSDYGVAMRIVDKLKETIPAPMRVGVCMATAGEFKKLPTPYKIGYTMYESDDPLRNMPEWRHDCAVLDQLFVPSAYCKDVFGQFVKAPIHVVPLVADLSYYATRQERRIPDGRRPYIFGMHGTLTGRKAPLQLIDCFQKAFPTERDVRLHLKTRLGILGYNQENLPKVVDRRVVIINEDWLQPKVRQWLVKQVDCYVFPSHGEGFGMPPREAMLAGCPTIVAENTGLKDFCNADYN
jgi:glycosyltransferase involved in cell wall biosynthesis